MESAVMLETAPATSTATTFAVMWPLKSTKNQLDVVEAWWDEIGYFGIQSRKIEIPPIYRFNVAFSYHCVFLSYANNEDCMNVNVFHTFARKCPPKAAADWPQSGKCGWTLRWRIVVGIFALYKHGFYFYGHLCAFSRIIETLAQNDIQISINYVKCDPTHSHIDDVWNYSPQLVDSL